ncbi:dynein axonemal assembly factor 1 homolog [Wyeomyia smithii]|uniref:dynein axonemal assembly factor 1 homolog n=1 Tax=Wyeomyia smithii TaxID=174621 RepID=UPI002467EEBF|nr:dynein axonemal assembly factor 1 homolog [Wyeomyia smithii]
MRMKSKSIRHRASIAKSALTIAVTTAFLIQVAYSVIICNYEKFDLYDAWYQKKTDDFCVFKDVFLPNEVRYADFMASSLDYKKVAFTNSKFPFVPPSLYRNFDDIRELYVRRCSIDTLRITRLIEKMYAGNNQITSIVVDGNGSNNLKELYLESNLIYDIANITNLPNLEVLVLENNPRIGDVDFAFFSRMGNLWKLDLENTGMRKITNSLKLNLNELLRLDLSNNELTYVNIQLFQTFPKLQHLWLNGNNIYFMEMEPVRSVVPDIRSIVIDDNYWGCQHLSMVSKYLLDNGVIIRSKECKSRSVNKVCCSDNTESIDNRYIIEMNIKSESKLHEGIKSLEKENLVLRQIVDGMRTQLHNFMQNYTVMIKDERTSGEVQADNLASTEEESSEDFAYDDSSELERFSDQDSVELDVITEEASSEEEQSTEENLIESESEQSSEATE